jgi:enoyl-CoA hydratase
LLRSSVTFVVPDAEVLAKALEWAELLASFPQKTLLADREAAIKGTGLSLDQGLAMERRLGRLTVDVAVAGAACFAGGNGRGGVGVPGMVDR